ncbi:hypothetical protein HPB50_023849 [Hyalomma asiaticum]|uniref:Uncharacterized protein n=1 Tax=Hyalomma asiaticum TaxID=266040 RepID=A0ACB7S8T1_HYAAI|nr:hypothetical protein HPB50_023849 [Hyalomma asiaticum]
MCRSASSGAELPWQSQAETYAVHQLREPKVTIAVAASLMLLLLLFVSIGAAIRRRHNSQPEVEKLHPAMARLYADNFTIEDNRGPIAHEGSYGVASAKSGQLSSPLLHFSSQDSKRSAWRRLEDGIKELDKLLPDGKSKEMRLSLYGSSNL